MKARTALCFARSYCPKRATCLRANFPAGTSPQFGDLSELCGRPGVGTPDKVYIHYLDALNPQRKTEL